MSDTRPAPYPADTRAKGWRFELDYEQIEQSGTWAAAMTAALDGLPLARPFLLAMWYAAWKQVPCGSLPTDDRELAGAIGIPSAVFAEYREVLLRGWWLADDGRLYHDTIAKRVLEMMGKRRSDSDRQAAKRAKDAASHVEHTETHDGVTRDIDVTQTGVGAESSTDHRPPNTSSPTVKKRRRRQAGPQADVEVVAADALVAAGFDAATATEFIAVKAMRGAPLTPRAWADHLRESDKAGWTPLQAAEKVLGKTWKGFEAKYVANEPRPSSGTQVLSFRERDQQAAAARVSEMTGGRVSARPTQQLTEVFDATTATPRLVG